MRIPYALPNLDGNELDYVIDAVNNGWGAHCFDYIENFERSFASYVGAKHAMATSSCTGALVLALKACGVGFGDEVILSDSNWVAAASAILTVGAKPVLVDVNPVDWCIDVNQVQQAVNPKTKAVIATHLYGNVAQVRELRSFTLDFGLHLIEDAAESLGSTFFGQHTGTFGDAGVYSFHGTKLITTGEGGMVVTNSDEIFELLRTLNNHGRKSGESRQFWSSIPGYKFRISNLQAALGLGQLERVEEKVARKRKIFEEYKSRLTQFDGIIRMNPEPDGVRNSYWMPTLIFSRESGITRDGILQSFQEMDIDARVFFWPLSSFDFLEKRFDNPNAYFLSDHGINLPSYEKISSDEISQVVRVIEDLIRKRV